MTGEYFCVSRKFCQNIFQRVDDLFVRASFEVRTADAHPEECVAAEGDVLLLAIEHYATRCVARCVEDQ